MSKPGYKVLGYRVLCLGVTLSSLLVLSAASAQASGGSLPLLPATERPARTELLTLVRQIQAQLDSLAQDSQTSDQVAALRSELEVLVLQAEIEKLQRDNTTLEGQLRATASGGSAAGTSELSNVPLERRIEQLSEQQRNLNEQLSAMAQQHAEMLAYPLAEAAPASSPSSTASSAATGSKAPSGTGLNTPATPPANTAVATSTAPPTRTRTYTVRPGDSLSELASTYYGDATRWPDILAANPQLTNPNVLFVGTRLTLPQ